MWDIPARALRARSPTRTHEGLYKTKQTQEIRLHRIIVGWAWLRSMYFDILWLSWLSRGIFFFCLNNLFLRSVSRPPRQFRHYNSLSSQSWYDSCFTFWWKAADCTENVATAIAQDGDCVCGTTATTLCAETKYCYADKDATVTCGDQRKNQDYNMPVIAQKKKSLIVPHSHCRNYYLMAIFA